MDHRFEHLGRDDHRLAGAARGARDPLLDAGDPFERHLHAEIAARHHQRIGKVDDRVEPLDRLRLLDLGHHRGAAARDLLDLGQVLGALHEGQRHPVDPGIERGLEVGAVLLGQRAEVDGRIGHAHALAVGEPGAGLDLHGRLGAGRLGDPELHLAVVEQQPMSGLERGEDFGVRQMNALPRAGRRLRIEDEDVARRDLDLALGKSADPELRPLQVGENPDRPADVFLDLANGRDQRAEPRMVGVAHVDAEDVRTRLEEAPYRRLFRGSRTEGRKDLDLARAPHRPPVPVSPGSVS